MKSEEIHERIEAGGRLFKAIRIFDKQNEN